MAGSEYAATFQLIDTDSDGYITAAEFKHLLDMLGGGSVPEETATSMFSTMDTDRDGRVNLEEMSAYLSSKPA